MRAKYVSIEVASARGIAQRWKSQRCRDDKWLREIDISIHEKLIALGDNPSIKDAADVIGNQSWTYISCDGCNESVERAVRIGSEYQDGHPYCAVCIAEAAQIICGESK